MICFIDTETRSATPIHFGTDLYTASAKCMIVTSARDDDKAELWDRINGQPIPKSFDDALQDPEVTLIAHNAPFDRRIVTRSLGRPTEISRWRCTQAQAYSHGLPGSLAILGAVLELPENERKKEDDAKLIHLFCEPRADGSWATRDTHPAEWERFCGYALNDTIALREIYKRLPTHNYRGANLETWWLDQLINERGFGFDRELAIAARTLLGQAKSRHDIETDAATGGAVGSATQRAKLLAWFNTSGLALPNMRAATIREWLEHDDLDPVQRFMLELRLDAAKSSGSKYRRGLEVVGADDRIRYALQFSGAGRTGRWSGRGFQPHNMQRPTAASSRDADGKRKKIPVKSKYIIDIIVPGIKAGVVNENPLIYGSPNEACANALRCGIVAAPDNELVVGDWSNIEGRILAWCAGEDWKLDAYRAADSGISADTYKLLFSRFFGTPLDEVDDNQRQVGKVVDLSCGYLASVGAFVTMALTYEIDLDTLPALVLPPAKPAHLKKAYDTWRRAVLIGEDYGLEAATFQACHVLVQVYREANAAIIGTGREVGKACLEAVRNPGILFNVARCKIWSTGAWLIIELPSTRRLLYSKPEIRTERILDIETGKTKVWEYLSYMATRGRSWRRERAWAGLFIENIVQAIANDVLRAALRLIHADTAHVRGNNETAISLHVHDEPSLDVPVGSYPLARLIQKMTVDLIAANDWMRGLPLAAQGWVGQRYHK